MRHWIIQLLLLVAWVCFAARGQESLLPVHTLGFGYVSQVAFSPDGRYLAVAAVGGSSVQLVYVNSWTVIRTLEGHTDGVTSVAFSPDGHFLVSGSDDDTVKLWIVNGFPKS